MYGFTRFQFGNASSTYDLREVQGGVLTSTLLGPSSDQIIRNNQKRMLRLRTIQT